MHRVAGLILLVGVDVTAGKAEPLPHDPAHAQSALTWCAAHAARRELEEALSDCNYAVTTQPTNSAALSNRATVHLLAGHAALARDDLTRAISLRPEDAILYFNRGLAHSDLGDRDRAIVDYSEAIWLRPDLAIAWNNRGIEFERAGWLDRARADFRRALELAPDLPQPRAGLLRLNGKL